MKNLSIETFHYVGHSMGGLHGMHQTALANSELPLVMPDVRQPDHHPGILPMEYSRMPWQEHITVNPLVMHGKACVRGTRIPVAIVLANLADGLSPEEIIRSYPSLTHEAIQATLAYAAELAQERVLPLPA